MPISVAYSLMSADHARIRAIAELTRTRARVRRRRGAVREGARRARGGHHALVARGERAGALRLDDLLRSAPSTAVEQAYDDARAGDRRQTAVHVRLDRRAQGRHQHPPDAVLRPGDASGGSGRSSPSEPPVLVDWLPWSHTFGANHNLNLVLFNGGTLYIDDGRPVPPLFPRTLAALKRRRADGLLQRAGRLRAARAGALESDRGAGRAVLQPASVHVLRRARRCPTRSRSGCARSPNGSPITTSR